MLAALLAAAGPVHAQSAISEAASALESTPVYVDPDAERALTDSEVERLRAEITRRDAGPMYVVVLPASASDEAGGDPSAALREIAQELREPGTYAGVIGDSFRAGALGVDVPASELARDSLDARAADGTFAVLTDFVRRVGEARSGSAGQAGQAGEGPAAVAASRGLCSC